MYRGTFLVILTRTGPVNELGKLSLLCSRARSTVTVGLHPRDASSPDYDRARPLRDMPGPRGMPFMGTLLKYRTGPYRPQNFHKALLEHYREYGPIFKETIAGETVVHLFDPEYIKLVYLNEGKVPHIPPLLETTQMYRKYRGLSPGLGNTNGEEWYRLRSAVQQMMMRPKAVTMYLPGVNEVAGDFLKRVGKLRDQTTGQVASLSAEIVKWNLESSGITCFEKRLGCLDDDPDPYIQNMIQSNGNIFSLSLKLKFSLPLYKYYRTPTWKRLVEAEDYFFGHGQTLVDETMSRIQACVDAGEMEDGRFAFLTYLMSKPELSYKDLSIITLSLFGDGLSTTVPTMIGQLYCLAANPTKQDALYEEVQRVTKNGEPITADMINNMPYLKACVKEGFRFFPIGTEVSRIPQKNLVIGGYQIPAGTHVELNNNMLLRLPEYFTDPDVYLPERWVRGKTEQNVHPYLLIPFGHGPRMCAGRRFAEQEMYVVIARLLQEYRLSWPQGEPPMEQVYNMLLKPSAPANFVLTPRH